MESIRLAVLGAGSVRCAPAVVASLATYFGERALDIRFYDADEERLDLFDLLARTYFVAMKSGHSLVSTVDPKEALEDVDRVVLMMDPNCLRLHLKGQGLPQENLDDAYDDLVSKLPESADVVDLEPRTDRFRHWDWPGEVPDGNTVAVALETLRIIRGEESPFPFLKRHQQSPLKEWLDGIRIEEL